MQNCEPSARGCAMTVQCKECNEVSRRSFITRAGAAFGAMAMADPVLRMVAQTYAQSTGGTGNILVLCQLNGGLDALSFLAPFTSPTYQGNRPQLALNASQVTPISDNPNFGINT